MMMRAITTAAAMSSQTKPGIGNDKVRPNLSSNVPRVAEYPFFADHRNRRCNQNWPTGHHHIFARKQPQDILPRQGSTYSNQYAAQQEGAQSFDALMAIRVVIVGPFARQAHHCKHNPV